MLINIETFLFNTLVDTQTLECLDAIEKDKTSGSSPHVDHQYSENLGTEEAPTATKQGTTISGQQTGHEGTENTTYAMYRASTYGVINMKFHIDELNGEDKHSTTYETDDHSSPGSHQIATSSDTHQTGQHTVEGQ